MPTVVVNYWAVLVAAASTMVVGFLWYGPLFGRAWMKLMGINASDMEKMKKKAQTGYLVQFIASLVTAYVLVHFLAYAGAHDAVGGMQGAFWAWLGFVVTLQVGMMMWENKPGKLFLINAAHYLVSFLVMGAILGSWR